MNTTYIELAPTIGTTAKYEGLYDESNSDWQYKAKRLQARRWRALKLDQNYGRRKYNPTHKI